MFVSIVTLIFTNFLMIIYAQPDEVLSDLGTTREEAEGKLAEIQPSQALPAVLFEHGNQFHYPREINEAWIVGGKIVNGTKFSLLNLQRLIFFCPKQDNPRCLVPQEFQGLEELRCSQEPMPILTIDNGIPCSWGTPHSVVYYISRDEGPYQYQYQYSRTLLAIYGVCFDNQEQKTIYTSHFILSPKLLQSNLLLREQQLSYNLTPVQEYPTNYEKIRHSLFLERFLGFGRRGQVYRLQQLVPSKHMAFGYLRKTTFLSVNYEFQHKDLFDLWNDMNEKVIIAAIRHYERGFNFHIITGVFDLSTDTLRNDTERKNNMWVTSIVAWTISESQADSQPKRGVVILMNNFINVADPTPDVEELQKEIYEYCVNSFCSTEFQGKVADIGVVARCCKTTEKVMDLFSIEKMDLPLIAIPGVV